MIYFLLYCNLVIKITDTDNGENQMTISLGEFVNYLVLLLQKNNVILPFHRQGAWHLLFYRLKKSPEIREKPAFLETLWFDWDGPYPKSPELSEYLNALRIIGVVETNSPKFDKYWISKDIERLWQSQFEKTDEINKEYLLRVVEIAKEEFTKVI